MRYKRHEHPHQDKDLVGQRTLAKTLGVTRKAVEKAIESGRVDTFDNAVGVPQLHNVVSLQQWTANKCVAKVSTPTRGQMAAGMDAEAAKAVAHLPLTNPAAVPAVSLKTWDPAAGPLDMTKVEGEKQQLAQSRAEKERHAARLLQVKVWEKEGELVSKSAFYQKAYTLAAAIKDKLNGIPPQLGPQVVALLEEVLVTGGHAPEAARSLLVACTADHRVRELLRAGITSALRDISAKPLEELIHV